MKTGNVVFRVILMAGGAALVLIGVLSGAPLRAGVFMGCIGAIFIGAAALWHRTEKAAVKRSRGTSVTELTTDCIPPRKINLSMLNAVPGLTGDSLLAVNAFIRYCQDQGDWQESFSVDIQARGYVALNATRIEAGLNFLAGGGCFSVRDPFVRRGRVLNRERGFKAEDSLIVFLQNAVIRT